MVKLKIYFKQVYETKELCKKQLVLILYDISANHYVGVPVYSNKKEGCLYLDLINKYADINKVTDYSRSKMCSCVYVKGRPLKISNKDFNKLLSACRVNIIDFLNNKISNDDEGFRYLKWCKDKFLLNLKDIDAENLKQNGIYWVNMGVNMEVN